MKLYRTTAGIELETDRGFVRIDGPWDALVNRPGLHAHLRTIAERGPRHAAPGGSLLAPIGTQEVWAAGVTYHRSRTARMQESSGSGGGSFYDRVYDAERPELFYKASPWRVRGPGETVRIRRDAKWSVPEPELALCINAAGEIIGCTIGNDMSSRDIEGENPLYLPQAKIYDGSCALGPAWLIAESLPGRDTPITIVVTREGRAVFDGRTTLAEMRRSPIELASWLYAETSFPAGSVLLTGTGVVPPDDFSLRLGDRIEITVPPVGTLTNVVA